MRGVLDEVFIDPPELFAFVTLLFCRKVDPMSQLADIHEFCMLILEIASENFSGANASGILFCTLNRSSSKRSADKKTQNIECLD